MVLPTMTATPNAAPNARRSCPARRGGTAISVTVRVPSRGVRAVTTLQPYDPAHHPRIPCRTLHRRHLRHGRSGAPRLSLRPSRLVQPRPGTAGDGPLPGAPPRVHQIEIGVEDQEYAPVPGIRELRRAVAELYNELYRKGMTVAVHRAQRLHLRRWPLLAHSRRRRAGRSESRSFSSRLHGVRGAARHLQALHRHSDSPRGRARLRTSACTISSGRSPGAGLSALLLSNPCNPTGKVIQGEELAALGGTRARAATAPCSSTSSIRTTSGAGATGRWMSRGARTWRTWTPIPSCSSTGSPRTGAIPVGASPGSSGRSR